MDDPVTRADLRRRAPDARRAGPDALEVTVPVRLTAPLGVIRARASESRLRTQLALQRRRVSAVALLAVAVIALALHLLHRRLVGARLARLALAAGQLRRGRMNARAEVEGRDEVAQLGEAFNAMATDLAAYTRDLEQLVAERTSELRKTNERLEHLAVTDPLTQLPNRRQFEERARRALETARIAGTSVSVACVDVDRFKSVNDRFGHGVGDQALIAVATTLREAARQGDLVARIGGEEFAVAMPDTSAADAASAAERLRAAVAEKAGPSVTALRGESLTASFGVATFPRHGAGLSELLSAADKALYRSKRAGRNCVTVADESREFAASTAAGSSERSTGS